MDSPSPSERGAPLQFVAIFLDVLTDLVGSHGTMAIVRRAGRPDWIATPPSPSLEARADPSALSDLLGSLEDVYGTRGSRGLGRRLGAALVDRCLADQGALAGVRDERFQALPDRQRARVGMRALGRVLTDIAGFEADVAVNDAGMTLSASDCPFCRGRSSAAACCTPLVGVVDAGLRLFAPDLPLAAQETDCRATGGVACVVSIAMPPPAG
jgi:hypothetical protein